MAFGNLKETNETNENKESSVDNTENPKNQILETPKDYEDDFDKKIDTADKKEEKSTESNTDKDKGGEDNKGFFSKIKGFFKQKEECNLENQDSKEENTGKSASESFRDSLKVTQSPEEVTNYNKEHGVSDMKMERPKGGVDRERGEGDPRWDAYETENEKNNKFNKNDEV